MSIAALLHVVNHTKALRADQLVLMRLADHATDSGLSWPARTTAPKHLRKKVNDRDCLLYS
jgi:hypothetical protein